MRFWRSEDHARMKHREQALGKNGLHHLSDHALFTRHVPANVRETIPVIAISDDFRGSDSPLPAGLRAGDPVALPTFGLHDDRLFVGRWDWLRNLRYDAWYQNDAIKLEYLKSPSVAGGGDFCV